MNLAIEDRWPPSKSGNWMDRHNPANSTDLVSRAPAMDADDVQFALERAVEGVAAQRALTRHERGQALIAAALLIRENSEDLAKLITRENGKTLAESRIEVGFTATAFEYFGHLARHPIGSVLSDRRQDSTAWTQWEPLGVVAIITPWNDPLATPARKIAPALLTGNSVLFKPAKETPLSSLQLTAALHDSGVPEKALNLLLGPSSEVSGPLLDSEEVRAISFTGSTAVGLELDRSLAGKTTRLQTEMGGKNATYVHADADVDLAVSTILGSACGQSGQRCTATSRVIAHASVEAELVGRLTKAADDIKLGPGLEEGVDMGPLVSAEHLESVLAAIETATNEGATIATGGSRVETNGLDRGFFIAPTVLTGVRRETTIWREEVFAPVLSVSTASTLDEGIALTNDSAYGLSSSIFTTDLGVAHEFIDSVDTGQVAVNLPTGSWDIHMPFGGFKSSGSSFKENSTEGLRFYSRLKSVAMKYK